MAEKKSVLVAGPMKGGCCGYLLTGPDGAVQAQGPDLASVVAQLKADAVPVLPVSRDPAEAVPVSVMSTQIEYVPGLRQAAPKDRADGWVRLAAMGFLAKQADWDGVLLIVFAGRSHWLHISANEVVSFQTALTPHLVTVLGGRTDYDPESLSEILSRPERLASALSRADHAGDGAKITAALIGAELAATRAYWLGQNLAVIAPDEAPDYATALAEQGVSVSKMALSAALEAAMGALWARL